MNSVWITGAHLILFDAYVAHHAREAAAMANAALPPRGMMAVTGPIIGLVSGAILGGFALIAKRIVGSPRLG